MEENIIKVIATQGVFALLFSYLLFYVLKETSTREGNYQNIIQQLTSILPAMKDDIEEIKEKLSSTGK